MAPCWLIPAFWRPMASPKPWLSLVQVIVHERLPSGTNYVFQGFNQININTLRPIENGPHFKCIFLKENVRISIEISLKFVLKAPINNIPA